MGIPRTPSTPSTPWTPLLGADPLPWLLECDEPGARWLTLTGVLRRPADDPLVRRAHAAVLQDGTTRTLLDRLPDWEAGDRLSGHDSPDFGPHLLNLLADLGVQAGDAPEVERLLDQLLAHQEPGGRFPSYASMRGGESPVWGALLCDSHAITGALVRFGRATDPRVVRALERMAADLTETGQGRAWPCLPHPASGWRGPGRKSDFCPMVTLQALRIFASVPPELRPPGLPETARVSLRAWRRRGQEKPYMFGHGQRFKTVKWPATWYSALTVLDALAGYPQLWRGPEADDEDRHAVAELAACLLAYNVGADGRVIPRSAFRSVGTFSFGQKRAPSAFATARVLATLAAYDDLVEEVAAVDLTGLSSSKGGSGIARPPAVQGPRFRAVRSEPGPRTAP
jgi:hypothetical protein